MSTTNEPVKRTKPVSSNDGPVRVLNVLGGTDLGGAESRIMDLFRHLDRDRVVFDFLVHMDPAGYMRASAEGKPPEGYRKRQHFDDEIERLGGRIYAVPRLTRSTYLLYVKALEDFFRKNKDHIDVLEGHMTSTASIYMKIARKYGISPIICHARSAGTGSGFKGFVKRCFRKGAYRYADHLFTCSEKAGLAVFGNRETVFIPNAIETRRFAFSPEDRAEVRREYGLENKRVAGHIGRFSYPKNHSFLLRVFDEMLPGNDDLMLLLVGNGELYTEVREEAASLCLGNRVIFAGERSDPERFYSAMDLMIFPSRYEGMPGSVVEAQANGLPCLLSDAVSQETAQCDLVSFLPLDDGEKAWSESALRLLNRYGAENREKLSEAGIKALTDSCCDAEALARKLTEFYTGRTDVFN